MLEGDAMRVVGNGRAVVNLHKRYLKNYRIAGHRARFSRAQCQFIVCLGKRLTTICSPSADARHGTALSNAAPKVKRSISISRRSMFPGGNSDGKHYSTKRQRCDNTIARGEATEALRRCVTPGTHNPRRSAVSAVQRQRALADNV
jgi:hypothetical protein